MILLYVIWLMIRFNFAGVWWQWFLPLLHQHICRPALWPAGIGAHLRWTRGGRRFWQPLLQSLPLSAVAHLFLYWYMLTVWKTGRLCTHLLIHSFILSTVPSVWPSSWFWSNNRSQVAAGWCFGGVGHNLIHNQAGVCWHETWIFNCDALVIYQQNKQNWKLNLLHWCWKRPAC